MGACLSVPEMDMGPDPRFRGLFISKAHRKRATAFMTQMDDVNRLPSTHISILQGMHSQGTWDIYLHITNWDRPITQSIISSLISAYRRACRKWLSELHGVEGFRRGDVKVRVFGFVFQKGVVLDPSFLKGRYRDHPRVTEWPYDTEPSPWVLVREGERSLDASKYYDPTLDLHKIRVVGNRTNVKGVTFHPKDWKSYTHPEKCTGFQTKYWLGTTPFRAFAQRHYLRVSGVANPAKGTFVGEADRVLHHEMGHCFFLDDMYDQTKYPPNTECACSLSPTDTIMHTAPRLTAMDHAMMRHVWQKSKAKK